MVTGTCALVTIVALGAASPPLVALWTAVDTTTDPILPLTVNGLLVSVAGLIAVAVGNELVIAHPQSQVSMALSLVLFGGPLLYLLSQTVYLWAVLALGRCHGWPPSLRWRWPGVCPNSYLPTQPWGSWSPSCSSWSSSSSVKVRRMQPHAGSSCTSRPDRMSMAGLLI